MKFIRDTFAYLKKSFWLLALICLAPAVTLGFFVKPLASITFVPAYSQTFVRGFRDVFSLVFDIGCLKNIYPPILIFCTLLISLCLSLSVIEKHFRVGKLILKKPFSEINNTFFPVLMVLLLLTAIMILYSFLLISLVSLSHYAICGAGKPNAGAVVAAVVISVVLFVLCFCFASPIIFMIPLSVIYGYSFSDAITAAFELAGKKPVSVVGGAIFPFAIVLAIEYILSFFTIIRAASIIVSTLMYLFIIVYLSAYVMVVMFSLSDLERRDKKEYYK